MSTENDSTEADAGASDAPRDFIREIIEEDLASGKHETIVTRFPPEPNGYLHLGHAKSIVLNHSLSEEYDGRFHLRFDDTNPMTEEEEYVESIKRDVAWLEADWGEHLYFASDYFERMYELAERLIEKGKAYVDSLNAEKIREYRGDWNEPGRESPYRDRSVEENLDLFRRMRDGEFDEGEHVLRAKIDMQADNMVMRDPVMYRIIHETHHHAEDDWCIYPMYDYAHCLEDAFEGITHSLCTMEFENNREVYNWFVRETEVEHQPRQIEFASGRIGYTVMSKRRLRQLVEEEYVDGWDDPRMPTISGLRRRGVTPDAIRSFWQEIGVARNATMIEIAQFEHALRDDLNMKVPRVLCVEDPLKVVVEGFPEDETDWIEAPSYPHDVPKEGSRELPFTRELYIDRDDFREDPPEDYYRLSPGAEVRLRYGYFVTCQEVVRDEEGEVVELRCSYDPETRGGSAPDDRDVQGTIHWVSAEHAVPCELRLYDRLFEVRDPLDSDEDFKEFLNPDSLVVKEGLIEPSVRDDPPGTRYQFERNGYYMSDPEDSGEEALVYNRIVSLRDTWEDREAERRKREAERRAEQKRREKKKKREEAERAEEIREEVVLGHRDWEEAEHYEPTPRDRARNSNGRLVRWAQTMYARHGLNIDEADILSGEPALLDFYLGVVDDESEPSNADEVAGWIVNEFVPLVDGEVGTDEFRESFASLPMEPRDFGRLIEIREEDRITSDAAEDVLAEMLETGDSPEEIIEREGLEAITDEDEIRSIIDEVFEENEDQVEAYGAGKEKLFGFFIGQVMRATDGKADPQLVRRLLGEQLPEPADE